MDELNNENICNLYIFLKIKQLYKNFLNSITNGLKINVLYNFSIIFQDGNKIPYN